ncbi:histone-like nucleoid-structuring protein Lsr2 [Actinoplanes auranticolor]|uniref:histone-like nucleoid-structuring protein Lsr2 n=1 Tax=Actinoplanes auranticolor TaxID=47988 RepID=UPI001BB32771|nr:Lsr2 family protein [Actinoplanes auranticolor]
MATRITRTVIDDVDGTDAAGTYRFALEDTAFEIDLSEANLARLRDALAPFIAAGRRLPKNPTVRGAARPNPAASESVKRMRRWWADNQHHDNVPEYRASGRLPQQVIDAYQQATTPQPN